MRSYILVFLFGAFFVSSCSDSSAPKPSQKLSQSELNAKIEQTLSPPKQDMSEVEQKIRASFLESYEKTAQQRGTQGRTTMNILSVSGISKMSSKAKAMYGADLIGQMLMRQEKMRENAVSVDPVFEQKKASLKRTKDSLLTAADLAPPNDFVGYRFTLSIEVTDNQTGQKQNATIPSMIDKNFQPFKDGVMK